ncbi:MAG TPA: 4Fe-4S dicluster domain-containing protein [Syntrophorhabdaceae bacterium]|nr:4Fe-4S dicluster domain-containing protein [Syntrophorhabdaceae bacterium]
MTNAFRNPAFTLDVGICIGCKTCVIACRDKNNLGPNTRWRRVYEYSGGEWASAADGTFSQNVVSYYISISCNHCSRPLCVEICPVGAMSRDECGIVTVDESICTGCRECEDVCPYSAPQYDERKGIVTKCDCCRDELASGGVPACVAACPTRALSFGEPSEPTRSKTLEVAQNDEQVKPQFTIFGKPAGIAAEILNREEVEDL